MPNSTSARLQDRAAGALMGAFIGDALALGPHWYYDLDELRATYGDWIDGYTDPQPGRYHAGLKAGQPSQAGVLLELTLRSLVERGGYDEADFCRRIDADFFPLIDGTPMAGPGGYTSQSIREAWRKRVQQRLPWGQVGGNADTTEAADRLRVRPQTLRRALCLNGHYLGLRPTKLPNGRLLWDASAIEALTEGGDQ